MRQFDLNELEVEQIEDDRLDEHFVGDVESLLYEDEWLDVTNEEYEAAIAAQTLTLKRVNEMLRARGVGLEFCETETGDGVDFILVTRDETEAEFADRVFG
jgi:hypothetical protein